MPLGARECKDLALIYFRIHITKAADNNIKINSILITITLQ